MFTVSTMTRPRTIPLFDPEAQPSSWSERMLPGEYAVLYGYGSAATGPVCSIFASIDAAETYARAQVEADRELRCRIYDHDGLGRPPVREFRGVDYKGESEITPRFRRWVGSTLFFGGLLLTFCELARRLQALLASHARNPHDPGWLAPSVYRVRGCL